MIESHWKAGCTPNNFLFFFFSGWTSSSSSSTSVAFDFFLMINGFITLNGSSIFLSSSTMLSLFSPSGLLILGGWGLTLRAGVRAFFLGAGTS